MEDEELIHLAFKRLFKRPQYGAKHRTHTYTRARAFGCGAVGCRGASGALCTSHVACLQW